MRESKRQSQREQKDIKKGSEAVDKNRSIACVDGYQEIYQSV